MPCHPKDKAANDEMRRLIDEHEMSESDLERDDNVSDIEEMVADNIHSLREARGIDGSEYVLMKTWVTGEKAVMEEEDIQMEIFDLARAWMNDSLLFKVPGQVEGEFDVALWKCFRSYRTRSGSHSIRLFHCPMHYLCNCNAGIRITTGPTYISLYKRGEHVATSHDMTRKAACRSLAYNCVDSTSFLSAAAMVADARPGDLFAALSPLERSIAEYARNEQLNTRRYGVFRGDNINEEYWARIKRVRFSMKDAFAQVYCIVYFIFTALNILALASFILFFFFVICDGRPRPA